MYAHTHTHTHTHKHTHTQTHKRVHTHHTPTHTPHTFYQRSAHPVVTSANWPTPGHPGRVHCDGTWCPHGASQSDPSPVMWSGPFLPWTGTWRLRVNHQLRRETLATTQNATAEMTRQLLFDWWIVSEWVCACVFVCARVRVHVATWKHA